MYKDHYPLMIPPINKSFNDFSTKETKQHFEWYVAQSDTRINQLQNYIIETGSPEVILDGTIESFIPLWRWFEGNIKTEKKTEEEIEAELVGRPEWVHPQIKEMNWKLTVLTLALTVDISFYFAKVFIDHNPGIKWGYRTKPKSLVSVNKPVLVGFRNRVIMDPRQVVRVCCLKSVDEKDETRLLDLYNVWTDVLPEKVSY